MQSILCPQQTTNIVADYTVSRLMAARNPTGVFTLANGLLNQSFYSNHGKTHFKCDFLSSIQQIKKCQMSLK